MTAYKILLYFTILNAKLFKAVQLTNNIALQYDATRDFSGALSGGNCPGSELYSSS